ncbi:MAG: UDP-N-acetylmuramate--L-alanine ligase, partial [Chlamydiia bacterium]|nr:UDP-N-acetylmuramate--L-alanine ligase [Chlamydiia bacterium]
MKSPFHFLGIGGIGMSALASILIEKGEEVSGSDLRGASDLEKRGVKIHDSLPLEGTIVYSSAIQRDHPLFLEAEKSSLPLLHRSELIDVLLKDKKGLLVTGTHGKTSTSALLAWTLVFSGKDPTYAVGGILKNLEKNGGYSENELFVLEADESDGSFLNYSGEGGIVTNIEKEHLDYWKTEERLIEGFNAFISKIKNPELFFWCSDDPLLSKLSPKGYSYGREGELKLLSVNQEGNITSFSASFEGVRYEEVEVPLMGDMLALNALAVFGLALKLGIKESVIRKAFKTYKGVKRRQEKIGEFEGTSIYDDYAHHPTEIKVLLESLKKGIGNRRLIALFQPHRYTRTRDHFDAFKEAFQLADLT